jgi:hypothetical protein
LRAIADQAANELTGIFDPKKMFGGGGGFNIGSLFGGGGGGNDAAFQYMAGNVPFFQSGGLVTSPTLAVVGEVPEMIIPLSRMNDSSFFEGVGGGKQETNVSFVIQTPDAESFRRSQPQIMAQAATALNLAKRNL